MSSHVLLACSILVLAFAPAAALHHLAKQEAFHIVPRTNFLCIEGEEGYLQTAMERLLASNMHTGWNTTNAQAGSCASVGFPSGPITETCFPGASIWSDDDPDHDHGEMDGIFIREYNALNPQKKPTLYPEIDCMYETQGDIVHIVPMNSYLCIEGHEHYIAGTLRHLQESNMQTGWATTTAEPGSCSGGGFNYLHDANYPPFGAGHAGGRPWEHVHELKWCFPKTSLWHDGVEEHDINAMDMIFVNEFNEQHPEMPFMTYPVIECMDRVGTIW